jgi:hypothetical protein
MKSYKVIRSIISRLNAISGINQLFLWNTKSDSNWRYNSIEIIILDTRVFLPLTLWSNLYERELCICYYCTTCIAIGKKKRNLAFGLHDDMKEWMEVGEACNLCIVRFQAFTSIPILRISCYAMYACRALD